MTPAEAAAFLRRYNEWRRTDDMYGMPYPDPREIGEAIDAAIEMIDRLEAAEKGRDALRAKIEQMERQEPVAWMCSDKAIIQMGYKKFSDRCEGCWNIPVFALPGAQPAPSVPDAWKLVPIEPTEAMVTAFAELFNVRDQKNTFGPAFRAALAAAPEAKP